MCERKKQFVISSRLLAYTHVYFVHIYEYMYAEI